VTRDIQQPERTQLSVLILSEPVRTSCGVVLLSRGQNQTYSRLRQWDCGRKQRWAADLDKVRCLLHSKEAALVCVELRAIVSRLRVTNRAPDAVLLSALSILNEPFA
jgi:hypothetical protein